MNTNFDTKNIVVYLFWTIIKILGISKVTIAVITIIYLYNIQNKYHKNLNHMNIDFQCGVWLINKRLLRKLILYFR